MKREQTIKLGPKEKPWLCSNCGKFLGIVANDTIRIKYKDLYATITRGDISILCRHCGTPNTLSFDGSVMIWRGVDAKTWAKPMKGGESSGV